MEICVGGSACAGAGDGGPGIEICLAQGRHGRGAQASYHRGRALPRDGGRGGGMRPGLGRRAPGGVGDGLPLGARHRPALLRKPGVPPNEARCVQPAVPGAERDAAIPREGAGGDWRRSARRASQLALPPVAVQSAVSRCPLGGLLVQRARGQARGRGCTSPRESGRVGALSELPGGAAVHRRDGALRVHLAGDGDDDRGGLGSGVR